VILVELVPIEPGGDTRVPRMPRMPRMLHVLQTA